MLHYSPHLDVVKNNVRQSMKRAVSRRNSSLPVSAFLFLNALTAEKLMIHIGFWPAMTPELACKTRFLYIYSIQLLGTYTDCVICTKIYRPNAIVVYMITVVS